MLRRALVGLAVVGACLTGTACSGGHPAVGRPGTRPLLVIRAPEAAAWLRVIRGGGLATTTGPLSELSGGSAAILPDGAGLSRGQTGSLAKWVRDGGRLVTADPAVLARVGITRAPARFVTAATMKFLTGPAEWPPAVSASPLNLGTGGEPLAHIAGQPGSVLLGGQPYGKGRVLALAADPMAEGRIGYELFPTLSELVADVTAAPPGPSRDGLEVFVDPAVLPLTDRYNFDRIADMLHGARIAEIAGWYFNPAHPDLTYPYASLIKDLHAHGVLAYAWLEPPNVTQYMWDTYPECREKTETGADAVVDWRHLESLETPSCFQLAWREWDQLLTVYPWDGVNVAELYFEGGLGPAKATPYSAAALTAFGRSPTLDPAGYQKFRVNLEAQLNKQMLQQLNGLPRASSLDFELTIIDSLLDPIEAAAVASNAPSLAAVARQGGASVEIEDPYTLWAQGPLRYERINAELAHLAPAAASLIDINIVDRAAGKPTSRMTGGELDLAAGSAAARSGRLSAYGLGTMTAEDMDSLPYAMATAVQTTSSGLISPWTVIAHAPPDRPAGRLSVDGIAWPTATGLAVIPAGNHQLVWSAGPPAGPGLVSFTGELSTASVTTNTMRVAYSSRPPVYALVTAEPSGLLVDGVAAPLVSVPDPAGGWSVRLPEGTHHCALHFA